MQPNSVEVPKWEREGLMFNKNDFDLFPNLVINSQELNALAFLKRRREQVHITGLTLLAHFDGRHRCLGAGDKVLIADGSWKNVEDIKIGDNVLSPQHDKTVIVSKVIAAYNHFEENVYDVVEPKLTKKRLYTCSGDHRIPLVGIFNPRISMTDKRIQSRVYKEYTAEHISKIKRAESSRVITFSTPPIDFKKSDSIINPYCLGLWLGDGHCSVTNKNTYIGYGLGITTSDTEIIESFSQNYPGEITSIGKKNGTTAVTVRITTKIGKSRFFNELKNLNLIGTKSGTKFIPKECLLSSIKYRTKLLAGLIDTDGHVPKTQGVIEITTKSEKMAKDILDLVCSLGGYGRITKMLKAIKAIDFVGEYYLVRFAFKAENLKVLADEVLVKHKKERLFRQIEQYAKTNRNHKNYDPRHISIKCIRTKPQMVYGFTLDSPSGLFITNDWIVTHNSGKSVSAALIAAIWDKTFLKNFERRVVHNAEDFLEEMRRIEKEGIMGAVILVDEAGQSMGASDWYQQFADAIQKSIQVFGYLHIIILFVSPVKDFLLSGLRKMTNMYIRVKRFNNQEANLIIYDIDYGLRKNRMDYYYKKPRLSIFGQKITLKKLKIRNPPKWFLEKYQKLEQERKPKIMEQLRNKGIKKQQIEAREGTFEDKVKFVMENYEMFKADRATPLEPKLDADLIKMSSLEVKTYREAQAVKKRAERTLKERAEKVKELIKEEVKL